MLDQDFGLPLQVPPLGIAKKNKCFFIFSLIYTMVLLFSYRPLSVRYSNNRLVAVN